MPVQNKPIIHGRDHETDGADPIRGLIPQSTGSYMEKVLAEPSLVGYWPLSDAAAPAVDVSGHGYHMAEELESPTYHLEGPFTASIYPYAVGFDGPHGSGDPVESLAYQDLGTPPKPFMFAPIDSFTLEIYAYWEADIGSMIALGDMPTIAGLNVGFGATPGEVTFLGVATTGIGLNTDTWVHVAATYDGDGTAKIYFDGALVGSGAAASWVSLANRVQVGGHAQALFPANWEGRLAHAAVYNEALTQSQIASHVGATGTGTPPPGWVLVPDPDNPGEFVWAPPGTEVEHGDGDPTEDPVTQPPGAFLGGPENASGWHLQAHYEYVVLYDSSPARFDVPPRKWTRVPFNTVRIQRSWELTVDGDFRTAWLEEDRGLTEHAKNGTLLVTAGMLFNFEWVSGWFTPEYPWLNWAGLPNSTGGDEGVDYYTRAARMTNVTHGSVLRRGTVGVWGELRAFVEYYFDATNTAQGIAYPVDNPYPLYPAWSARPLNKPLPYPKFSNAVSLANYTDTVGGPGFDLDYLISERPPVAGDTISLQAWQDSPWLLRFGTDKYPPYTPYNLVEQWRKRPALVLHHFYDPDTIDHDTGALL